ncbi:MAG: hypothetical protein J6B89_00085 [Bacilli bacterium]|nr:hypothetical protein [Bacilli bacterium]
MNNFEKFNDFRNMYPNFIFDRYIISENDLEYKIDYFFEIVGLTTFNPSIVIGKNIIKNLNINVNFVKYLAFHIGMVEAISYIKCTCSPNFIVKAGYLDDEQIAFFKKLYYSGLGEFLYTNGINIEMDELFNIQCVGNKLDIGSVSYNGLGNLIPVGGGKDSIVTLELLKNEANNSCFIMNPKEVTINCCKVLYNDDDILTVKRNLDRKIVDINNQGFLNGHTPFSALLAFLSYLVAYLSNKKYIVLSNESSANEESVVGTGVNHQYSKTYEFENDFNNYALKNFNIDIKYFSLLRPLTDFQIAKIFANFKEYHSIFKSCNLGSKGSSWQWCCDCPKCLFIYIILSPFLKKNELIDIFGEDLYERDDLLQTFIELLGYSVNKPFECVGTYDEVKYAVSLAISKYDGALPYLLNYYKDNYPLFLDSSKVLEFNEINNLDDNFKDIVRKAVDLYV